jgi:hypothetical protein
MKGKDVRRTAFVSGGVLRDPAVPGITKSKQAAINAGRARRRRRRHRLPEPPCRPVEIISCEGSST